MNHRTSSRVLSFALLLLCIFNLAVAQPVFTSAMNTEDLPFLSVRGGCYILSDIENESFPENGGIVFSGFSSDTQNAVLLIPSLLSITSGDTVQMTFLACQTADIDASVCIFLDNEKQKTLYEQSIPSCEWTTVNAEFTYTGNRQLGLILKTENADDRLYIKDLSISVTAHDDKALKYEKYPLDLPSLKEKFLPYFTFGTAIGTQETKDPKRMRFYAKQFGIVTPGNELKPDAVFDKNASRKAVDETGDETQVKVRIASAKPILDFCLENNIPVHGHTLLWHSQTPEDFFHLGYDSKNPYADRDIMLARMENYIHAVLDLTQQCYPGLIVSWDVVNEAIDDSTGKLRTKVNWYKTVGPDYVSKAFEYARKYARADILLCYNDYNTTNSPKLGGILELLEELSREGNIDCYGFQSHYDMYSPGVKMVESAMNKVIALGLKIRVSELDVTIKGKTDTNLRMQTIKYKELFELYMRMSDYIVSVQTWGGTDDTSWRSAKYPLIFAAYGQPKDAFWALLDLFAE